MFKDIFLTERAMFKKANSKFLGLNTNIIQLNKTMFAPLKDEEVNGSNNTSMYYNIYIYIYIYIYISRREKERGGNEKMLFNKRNRAILKSQ